MKKAKLTGDFSGSSITKGTYVNSTLRVTDLQSELMISDNAEIQSFLEKTKDCIKSSLLATTFHKALMERNVDENKLRVYIMHFCIGKKVTNPAEYAYSIIKRYVKLDSYENAMFVFLDTDRSKLLEVWPGANLSTTAVYVETAKAGYFSPYNGFFTCSKEILNSTSVMYYYDIRLRWIREELKHIYYSIFDIDDILV